MSKFDTVGRTFVAIVCTVVMSATMVLGAVGPAEAGHTNTDISRMVA